MIGTTILPPELLTNVVWHLNTKDLLNCTLAFRAISEAAKGALYHDLVLTTTRLPFSHGVRNVVDDERQMKLINIIAQNPKIGALVRNFTGLIHKGHETRGSILLSKAAGNMSGLIKATIEKNILTATVVENLPVYSRLSVLSINGFSPHDHIWNKLPTSLTSLTWRLRTLLSVSASDQVEIIVRVVNSTCPNLKSLDITLPVADGRSTASEHTEDRLNRIQQYYNESAGPFPQIQLQHFGLRCTVFSTEVEETRIHNTIQTNVTEVLEKHGALLSSLILPFRSRPWTRNGLDFISKVPNLVPNLKSLELIPTVQNHSDTSEILDSSQFFLALTTRFANAGVAIERFSIGSTDCPFSADLGKAFQAWDHLRFLQLGDSHDGDGFFHNDGRPDFKAYKSKVLGFIKNLPPSLEELYLEIHGEDLCVDEDEDFDPFCYLGPRVFRSLKRLHTCDFHAWISNLDGGLSGDGLPEKSVHYRRLPHSEAADGSRSKNIWTSTMDCVYQEDYANVSKRCDVVELSDSEGGFEGEDAREVWLGGWEGEPDSDENDDEGEVDSEDDEDEEREYRDKRHTYAMYRSRQRAVGGGAWWLEGR